jgi:putative acetyltransferase
VHDADVPPCALRVEVPGDEPAIRAVVRASFDGTVEADLIDRLRQDGDVVLSLVAVDEALIVGHILFSNLTIADGEVVLPALALAPVAVIPGRQGRGIGSALIAEGLARCRGLGHRIVIVVGHPAYYERFGFSGQKARALRSVYAGEAFMALELTPGALDGVTGDVQYARAFEAIE